MDIVITIGLSCLVYLVLGGVVTGIWLGSTGEEIADEDKVFSIVLWPIVLVFVLVASVLMVTRSITQGYLEGRKKK